MLYVLWHLWDTYVKLTYDIIQFWDYILYLRVSQDLFIQSTPNDWCSKLVSILQYFGVMIVVVDAVIFLILFQQLVEEFINLSH